MNKSYNELLDYYKDSSNEEIILDMMQEADHTVYKLQQENKQLKDNWNKLKDIIKEQIDNPLNMEFELFSKMILRDMQELEKGDSNE